MPFKALITILICNAVFAVISVPLILRKVPRNTIYGFRIRATLEDDYVWYEVNAYFGRGFLMASIVSAFCMILVYFSDAVAAKDFMAASLVSLIIPQLIVILLTFRFIKTLK